MRLSRRGARLIESFEGFRSCPYRDAVGVWTIGYGSTKGVGPNTKCVTRQQAEERLMREVDNVYGHAVNQAGVPLDQNQFDALTSFVYNVGPGAISSSTGVGRALRARDHRKVCDELLRWDKAGGRSLAGLTRRRKAERSLYLSRPERAPYYTAKERKWIREYDRLRKERRDKPRRRELRALMTGQRKKIWQAAQKYGWDGHDRRRRYHGLMKRTT